MNKKFTLILAAACATAGLAQVSTKLTSNTLMDLMRSKQAAALTTDAQQSAIMKAPSVQNEKMSVFVKYNDASVIDSLKALGATVEAVTDNVLTARLPLNAVEQAAELDGIEAIEAARKVEFTMDSARIFTFSDKVQSGEAPLERAFLGKGVLVGDIDGGLDFTHPAFYTADRSTSRLKRVWLQDVTTGTPPAGFEDGTELTTPEEISAKGTDLSYYSHSTHVMNIAAGSDTAFGGRYRGQAPEADLIFSNFNNQTTGIANAIKYMFNYADSVKQPAVVNMSLGLMLGPHDGTSLIDQMCDNLAAPGHVVVGSAGNNGLVDCHISRTFTGGDTLKIGLAFLESLGMPGTGEFELWGEEGKSFKVSVCTVDKETMQPVFQTRFFNASRSYNGTVTLQKPYDLSSGYVNVVTQVSPLNNKPMASISTAISDYKPDKIIAVMIVADEGVTVHGWANPTYCCWRQHLSNQAVPDRNYQTTEIAGVGKNIITVGSWASRMSIKAASGDTLYATAYNKNGIAAYSNMGPTADGRIKPDVTAPGSIIVSAISSYNSANTGITEQYTYNDRTYNYGVMEGTSMSAPQVSGIVATWLEAVPTLTTADVRDVIAHTADRDSITGAEPNNTWGYGRINAFEGLKYVLKNYSGVEQTSIGITEAWRATVNADKVQVLYIAPQAQTTVQVYALNGALVKTVAAGTKSAGDTFDIDLGNLANGAYVVRVQSTSQQGTYKVIKQ